MFPALPLACLPPCPFLASTLFFCATLAFFTSGCSAPLPRNTSLSSSFHFRHSSLVSPLLPLLRFIYPVFLRLFASFLPMLLPSSFTVSLFYFHFSLSSSSFISFSYASLLPFSLYHFLFFSTINFLLTALILLPSISLIPFVFHFLI